MGFVGDLFAGNKGMGYQAEGLGDLGSGVSGGELQDASNGVSDAMAKQNAFLAALQAQGGIGKQTGVFDQQQALANQLGLQAQGQGPNPALAQLSNTTGQNVANQAALMGSQRGSSANVGLMARQAAMQGGAAQQQAAGQAAVLRAQQQLAAQQALQQQQAMMGGLSTQMVGQQANATGALNQAAQARQQMYLNAQAQSNATRAGMQGNMNAANGAVQGNTANAQSNFLGGLMSGAGAAAGMAQGGMVHNYADGGMAPSIGAGMDLNFQAPQLPAITQSQAQAPKQSFASAFLSGEGQPSGGMAQGVSNGVQGMSKGLGKLFGGGGDAASMSGGAGPKGASLMMAAARGGKVGGKAEVSGDSTKNDKVPAMLSPKEIVLPRSVTMSENAPDKAAKFVAAILAKENLRKRK